MFNTNNTNTYELLVQENFDLKRENQLLRKQVEATARYKDEYETLVDQVKNTQKLMDQELQKVRELDKAYQSQIDTLEREIKTRKER